MLIYERKSKKDLKEYSVEEENKHKVIDFRSVKKHVPNWISDTI